MDFPLLNFGIALGLGLLVGLQRERAASLMAGIRTFPLVTLFGTVCGYLAGAHGGWVLSAGIGATAVLLWAANVPRSGPPADDPGLTTEAALLVMFGVGALAGTGDRTLAVVLGATTAVLLHLRPELHAFAARIADSEMRAVMQFAVVALIVLPLLPEGRWGPYGVLNPRQIWWMVVLITGISLASYLAYRLLGDRGGALAAGFLGGLISSTATTVATARGSRAVAGGGSTALPLLVIQIASTVVFGRVLLLVAAAAPDHFVRMARLPMAMLGIMSLAAVILGWRTRRHPVSPPPASNPAELRLALTFAALFVAVLLAVAAARERLGNAGLYAVAVLSGLTDMDAITLSTAQLARRGELDGALAGRVILVAALANLAFKAGAVAVLGSRELARHVGMLFGAAILVGAVLLAFP